eukprot:3585526-Prymnesium_polylepis.2
MSTSETCTSVGTQSSSPSEIALPTFGSTTLWYIGAGDSAHVFANSSSLARRRARVAAESSVVE